MPDVVRDPRTFIMKAIVHVNCSDLGLGHFPPVVPLETKSIWLERNYIYSLNPLIANPYYKDVQDVYLDYNFISNVDELEGAYWLDHFRLLSLVGNRLSQVSWKTS